MVEWEEAARWRNVKSFQLSGEFNLKNRCCQLCFVVLDTNLLPWCCSKWFWIKLECAGMHLTAKLRHFCVILAFVSIFLYSHIHAHLCHCKSFTCKECLPPTFASLCQFWPMTDTRCPSLFIYLKQLSTAARFCLLDHVLLTHGEMRPTSSDFKYISPPWMF